MQCYRLRDREVEPCTIEELCQFRTEVPSSHYVVAESDIKLVLRTEFFGIDLRGETVADGRPLVFETALIRNDMPSTPIEVWRRLSATWYEAEQAHRLSWRELQAVLPGAFKMR